MEITVDFIKDWLEKYSETDEEIETEAERIVRLRNRLEGVSSPAISDMPGSPSKASDKTSSVYVVYTETLDRVSRMIDAQTKERKRIEDIIQKLSKAEEKEVIRLRYIDGLQWKEVTEIMYGNEERYEEQQDSYLRKATKKHGTALVNMARILEIGC